MKALSQLLSNLLTAFIVLKLVGYIEWSWAWVLSPLWGPVLIVFAVMTIINARKAYKAENVKLTQEQVNRYKEEEKAWQKRH